jgi:hypothetical protein
MPVPNVLYRTPTGMHPTTKQVASMFISQTANSSDISSSTDEHVKTSAETGGSTYEGMQRIRSLEEPHDLGLSIE